MTPHADDSLLKPFPTFKRYSLLYNGCACKIADQVELLFEMTEVTPILVLWF